MSLSKLLLSSTFTISKTTAVISMIMKKQCSILLKVMIIGGRESRAIISLMSLTAANYVSVLEVPLEVTDERDPSSTLSIYSSSSSFAS